MREQTTSVVASVVRSAPWRPIAGTAAAAALLWAVAFVVNASVVGFLAAVSAIAVGGASAAFLLDEEAADVADATPTSRARRVGYRLLGVAVPGAVALGGITALAHADATAHWLRLTPLIVATLAAGAGASASLRRRGVAAPGDLAASLVFCTVVVTVAVDPARRWVSIAPLQDPAHVGRTVGLCLAVAVAGLASVLVTAMDPGLRRHH